MRFWVREIAGWLLVLLGVYMLIGCYSLLANVNNQSRILEAGPMAFIGFIVFRGGIHLLKVAMAARVCLHAQAVQKEQSSGPRQVTLRDPRAGRYTGPTGRP